MSPQRSFPFPYSLNCKERARCYCCVAAALDYFALPRENAVLIVSMTLIWLVNHYRLHYVHSLSTSSTLRTLKKGLRSFIRYDRRHQCLENDEKSGLVCNFSFFCSSVASLRFCSGRCFSFSHFREYSCHSLEGSALIHFVHHYRLSLASYASILRIPSRASYCSLCSDCYPSRTLCPFPGKFGEPSITYSILPSIQPPACVFPILTTVGLCLESPLHPLSAIPPTYPSDTVTAAQPLPAVPTITSVISTAALTILVSISLLSKSSSLLLSVPETIPALTIGSSAFHLPPAFVIYLPQHCLPPAAFSSLQPPVVPEAAVSSTLHRRHIVVFFARAFCTSGC